MEYLVLLAEIILFQLVNCNDLPFMSGFYTDGLHQAVDKIEIVYPEKISKDGSRISYYLPHFYDIDSEDSRQRRMSGHTRDRKDEAIHFYVPIEGERNHLELWPNSNFISPGLVIERRDGRDVENINKAKISQVSNKQCHYNGHIVGKPDSSVALSTCYGLVGYIREPHGEEYLIEPVKDFKPEPNKEHPHIIYKRSMIKNKQTGASNCLTKGSAKEALDERMKWEALYGDQVRKALSGINMNEIITGKSEPSNVSPEEKLRYINNNLISADSRNNIDATDSKSAPKLDYNFRSDSLRENSNKELINKQADFGDNLKQKSMIEEKNTDDSFKSIKSAVPIKWDNSILYQMNHRIKRESANTGHIVKRDLKVEDSDQSKLNNDNKQNAHLDSKSNTVVCGNMSSADSQNLDDKMNKLENTGKNSRDDLSNNRKLDSSFKSDFDKNKEKIVRKRDQDTEQEHELQNGQRLSNEKDGRFNIDSDLSRNIKTKPINSHEMIDEILDTIKDYKKRNVHLDTSDKSWQINNDVNNVQLKQNKAYDKRSQLDTKNTLPSEISSLNKIVEGNEKFGELVQQQSISTNDENAPSSENVKYSVSDSFKDKSHKQKTKKEISDNRQQEIYPNPSIQNENSLYRNLYQSNNKDMVNDKSQMPILTDPNKTVAVLDKDLDNDLTSGGSSETSKNSEMINPGLSEEVVIHIKFPEGSDNKSPAYDVSGTSGNEQYGYLEKDLSHPSIGNENRRVNTDDNIGYNMKNKLFIEKELGKNIKGFESKNVDKINFNEETKQNPQNKIKRHDNTIRLKIETDPEFNNAEFNNMNSKTGLFCQGINCLEIKPVILNASNHSGFNNNTNAGNLKSKVIEKRYVPWNGFDCTTSTSTEIPHLCFDIYSKLFNVEMMIVVDYKVTKLHDDADIENFILTIINMVSTNFVDKSLVVNLNIVLVRMIILTTCIKELDSDRFNPEELLENFCTWQVLINPGKDDHPHHHDLAVFVTRLDKCEGKIMGLTYMTSICRPDKSCLVCVDEGLLLANTITHLIGHGLGAEHDDSESSGCSATSKEGTNYHMAPTIYETNSGWSACSKDAITQFLKTQGSWCLTDLPVDKAINYPMMLPGQIYSAAQQCKLNFHMTSIPCSIGSFCEKLYCQVTDKLCATKGDPPADGTFCAGDMWCFHKQCVHVGRRPGSVNGEWGPWTEWSTCTRSCGGGVSSSFRVCNNPKPDHGGRFCIGDRIRHRMCQTEPCKGFTESFRDLQCKRTEDRPFRGRLYNWVQYTSHFLDIQCALVCQNRRGDVVMRSPIVADGTPCKPGTRNVCIRGSCRTVGCDWVIDSKAKEDACGICHGNSTECKIIQGVFDEPCIQKGLVEFLRIPKKSGMIFVREINPSRNIIVVSGAINRVFYLNGVGSEDSMPGDVNFGSVHGVYEVRSGMERIFIRGPTTEDLICYVLFREQNTGIHFQYAIPDVDFSYVPRYLWQYIDWDPCTVPCSGGAQRAQAKCVEDRGGVVDDQYCTETTRPTDIIRPCNDFPCQAKWWASVWSDCICTGESSVMFRSVLCMRATDESGNQADIVTESECSSQVKPPAQKSCNITEFDNDCSKRSIYDDHEFGSLKLTRRSVNPETAYSAISSDELYDLSSQEQDVMEGKEKSSIKNPKKPLRQSSKSDSVKEDTNKVKSKLLDKEMSHLDTAQENDKNAEATITKTKGYKESKYKGKDDELPLGSDRSKQLAKLTMKSGASLHGGSNSMKSFAKARQAEEKGGTPEQNDEKCQTTSTAGSCPTQEPSTTDPSTCKLTNPVHQHRKTTCCKTSPRRRLNTKSAETTTSRPAVAKMDEISLNNFSLTLVPLDFPNGKKLPQTDPEFINLGNIGQFGAGDEENATILSGQEAIDFLDFARQNATEEPYILHEDMH